MRPEHAAAARALRACAGPHTLHVGPLVDTHVDRPAGYSFNRHDAWTHMHDWGCFNWNWVHKMQRRQDPEEKDKYFM